MSVQTVNVVQTNWTPRYITNLIEVSAPQNVFVTEYRTNWIQRSVTNVVEVALTNWSTRTLTNITALTLFRTNFVDRYATNWTVVAMTNCEHAHAHQPGKPWSSPRPTGFVSRC